MFEIDAQYKIKSSLPLIDSDYDILHFDDHPILYTGRNLYKNRLLGSFSYEDYDNDLFRHFTIIISENQYKQFQNGKLSYLNLINGSQEVFVIDKDINDNVLSIFEVPTQNIPIDYLPTANSYAPEQIVSSSFKYTFILKGKLADYHKALVGDINNLSQHIYNYLLESLKIIEDLIPSPTIYSQPAEAGSYRLNFDIEVSEDKTQLFSYNKQELADFINNYLNYVAYTLPEEEEGVLESFIPNSSYLKSLQTELENIYNKAEISSSNINDKLIDGINSSATKLSEVTEYIDASESFDALELGNYSKEGYIHSIGDLNKNYKSSILNKLLPEYQDLIMDDVIEIDSNPVEYRILVYRLNRETGKGAARLYFQDEFYNKVNLQIDIRNKALSNSIFTKSLDEDKVVSVMGIATKRNYVYKKLRCEL